MVTVRGPLLIATALSAVLAPACSSDAEDPHSPSGRTALAYESAVRSIVAEQQSSPSATAVTTDPDDRPVVYVVAAEGELIEPDVQAEVAEKLVDDIDVRFADARDEAVESDEPDEPVRSGGVLLVVGDLPEGTGSFDLVVERYVSAADREVVTMTFRPEGDAIVVTSTSLSSLD
jgi:hypothetical protein